MEDIVSENGMNIDNDNGRNYNDDLLETRSESDIPVRPPRPSKYGTKLFKNLSMDEIELRSKDPDMTSISGIKLEDTSDTLQISNDTEDIVQFHADVCRDTSSALVVKSTEIEDQVDATEEVDYGSPASERSTVTTDEELDYELDILHNKREESSSDGDDDTLIYYHETNESADSVDTTKRQSKRDSDYCRVYDTVHDNARNMKIRNIHCVQEEQALNEIITENNGATGEVAGMIHVAPDQNKQGTTPLSNENDGVSLNVPFTPGLQHLDFHFHINLNITSSPLNSAISHKNANHPDITVTSNATNTKRPKRNASIRQVVHSSPSTVVKEKPDIPATPPVPIQKEKTGRSMPKRSNTLPSKLAERPLKPKTRSFGRNLGRVLKSVPLRREPEDYDEIDVAHHPKEIQKLSFKDNSKSSMHSLPTVLDEEQPYWLYDYQAAKQAEESIRTEKNGSFAVIQEDSATMLFTPYTLLVVHEGQILRIPVIKHRPVPIIRNWFSQSGTLRVRDSFALAASPGDKMKSIEEIVAHYQKHDISGIKLKLNPTPC